MNAEAAPALRTPGWRWLSSLLAGPISLVLLLHPVALLDAQGHYSHGLLSLMMWGIATGYVHGVGFDPRAWAWRLIFHPSLGWVLMALGYWVLLRNL
ncbi:cyd operon YbgE family protein [Pseudomonas coleopterorum]|uniref:cyd operon YbgE family protein n=1 Tax=Pseudomonas coleopterorum TaxID=1605838 RepID=UPI0008941C5D|nr:cyd operon YbgE family protein [Pseudomonas coleopterorum]SEE44669.1 cyd operon protein YbgE [Pseudomonas coleopterorum]